MGVDIRGGSAGLQVDSDVPGVKLYVFSHTVTAGDKVTGSLIMDISAKCPDVFKLVSAILGYKSQAYADGFSTEFQASPSVGSYAYFANGYFQPAYIQINITANADEGDIVRLVILYGG